MVKLERCSDLQIEMQRLMADLQVCPTKNDFASIRMLSELSKTIKELKCLVASDAAAQRNVLTRD